MAEQEQTRGEAIADGLSFAHQAQACARVVSVGAAWLIGALVVVGAGIEYGPMTWRALKWAASLGGSSFWLPVVCAIGFMIMFAWFVCVHIKTRETVPHAALFVGEAGTAFGWAVCWYSALETFKGWADLNGFQWIAMFVASVPSFLLFVAPFAALLPLAMWLDRRATAD
jgi:hypothetical protein